MSEDFSDILQRSIDQAHEDKADPLLAKVRVLEARVKAQSRELELLKRELQGIKRNTIDGFAVVRRDLMKVTADIQGLKARGEDDHK